MARPYWSGQIQISLVAFGVKLFVATESKSDIHFHQIDRKTGERVKHQKVLASAMEHEPDEAHDPVEQSQIVKGFEYSKGQYVTIEPDEIAHLRVSSKHTMEVTQFVDADSISPEYFEKPYFVVPENDAQTEAFLTVRRALIETKKVALSKIAFAGREHVVAIVPAQVEGKGASENHGGMMAYTMRYAAEFRDPNEYFRDIKSRTVDADSLSLAKELIKRKSHPFDPTKFVDGYEIALKELVDAKLKHAPIPKDEAPAPTRGKVINLMDALRKSVADKATAEDDSETDEPVKKKAEAKKGPTLVKSEAHHAAKSVTKRAGSKSTKPAKRKIA